MLLPDDCEKDLVIVRIVPIIGPVSKAELNRDNDSCLVDCANIQLDVELAEMMVTAPEYSAMNPVRIAVACVTGAGIVTVTFWICGPEPTAVRTERFGSQFAWSLLPVVVFGMFARLLAVLARWTGPFAPGRG